MRFAAARLRKADFEACFFLPMGLGRSLNTPVFPYESDACAAIIAGLFQPSVPLHVASPGDKARSTA